LIQVAYGDIFSVRINFFLVDLQLVNDQWQGIRNTQQQVEVTGIGGPKSYSI
jgi:hypothetical protein